MNQKQNMNSMIKQAQKMQEEMERVQQETEEEQVEATSGGGAVKVVVNGKTLVLNKDYKVAYSNNIKPGKAKVVITGIGSYKGTVTKTFVIKKAAQSITKAVVSKTFKASSLKKKAATFNINAKAKGKITYKKTSGSKNITVSKSGKVTVKKGTKKGTYTIKVKITAAATSNFNKATVTKTIKVVVK